MVVISLPHASLLHPVALRRPLVPHQSSFISAKRTRAAIPLPRCKCSKRGFRFAVGHRGLLDAETPLSICEVLRLRRWRLVSTAKPQPKNKAGAGDQPGVLRVRPPP